MNTPDRMPPSSNPDKVPTGRPPLVNTTTLVLLFIIAIIVGVLIFSEGAVKRSPISWGMFRQQLAADNIEKVEIQGTTLTGAFRDIPEQVDPKAKPYHKEFVTEAPNYIEPGSELDQELLARTGGLYSIQRVPDRTGWVIVVYLAVTLLLFGAVYMMIRRTREQMMGGGVLPGFSKSPAKRYSSGDLRVTFDDVAGVDSVKTELEELVEYLKSPEKFQRMGARVPKGVLLMGAPGTGKTLLARAVAGEAGVPFFSVNGSEFIQMFVGVGASRVRDLFSTAKAQAPAILFIDEIDAVGRLRGTGVGGGHDEREQTLNQILSEMDGFSQTQSVIVIAATNRPDVLDPALLRPGRFDRHITVDRPTYKGRLAIFQVHTRGIPLASDINFDSLAAGTVGLTGADIRNLVNEATLWATRRNKENVVMADFEYAKDKIFMGAKREEMLTEEEKRMTAYHEAGHALVGWLEPENDRVHKVTIIPRGRALGATQILPDEDQVHISAGQLKAQLAFILGGRAAEQLVFGELGAGAENDLQRATQTARNMVTRWGMSERLGPVAFRATEHHPFLGKEMAEVRQFSEHTAQLIDEEIVRILVEAHERAIRLLESHRDKLDRLATTLEREEELNDTQIEAIIGPPLKKPRKLSRLGGVDRPQLADLPPSEEAAESAIDPPESMGNVTG